MTHKRFTIMRETSPRHFCPLCAVQWFFVAVTLVAATVSVLLGVHSG